MIGVFIKNSFNLIFNLTSLIIVVTISIILVSPNNDGKNIFRIVLQEMHFQIILKF